MSVNIRNYVSNDHIESIGEIATGQARIIQALILDNSQKDKEIERLNNIIKEAINYIDDNTYYKDHKGHINIDDLYIILQKGSDSNENN